MSTLASILRTQGKLAEARVLQEKLADIACSVWGQTHPKTLVIMGSLAGTLFMERDFHRARGIQKEVLAAHLRIQGKEHPSTTRAAWNLVHTLHGLQDHREVKKVLSAYLVWLLHRAPETLQAEQRTIRKYMAQFMRRTPAG